MPNSMSSGRVEEYFVGKVLSLAYLITDDDGFNPSGVTVKWYEFASDGTLVDYSSPLGVGDTYTITNNEVGSFIGFEISYTDDIGTTESVLTYHYVDIDGDTVEDAVVSTATNTPNTVRNVFSYPELETHLTNNGLSNYELSVRTLAATMQGKWGDALGTAPQLSYSITNPGLIEYSALQRAEHSLYQDIHNNSTATGSLSALKFSKEEEEDLLEALSDWSKITGITFTDATDTLGNEADIVFTKLDFEAWYSDVYGSNPQTAEINPGSAGFAFTPSSYNDFLVGDVFLSSDLVARNLDTKVYDLTTSHVTAAGFYVLRGNDSDGYDAYAVSTSTDGDGRTVYSMSNPDTPTQTGVFTDKGAINSAGLSVAGYLDGGMSVKGVASH